jgi:two-component system response regulator HydG
LRCLVAGAEPDLCETLRTWAAASGVDVDAAPDQAAAERRVADGCCDALLVVLRDAPDAELARWAEVLARTARAPSVLVVANRPSMDLVVSAVRSGFADVFPLPPARDEFLDALERIRSARDDRAVALPPVAGRSVGPCTLVGESAAMCDVYKQIALVAASDATVTIQGESGTGKELVARAIHALGPRRGRPFVAFNCAAIPDDLLESELFGHEKGAFTGAVARTSGRFFRANGGTLFLDEVADMSPHLQPKILRAVEEREIEPVGGGPPVPVDIRVIAATNHDLAREVEQGRFRADLFHRLSVVTISLPRLAERRADIDLLTAYFTRHFAERHGRRISAVSERALSCLRGHRWDGNVRELRNVIERAVVVSGGDTLRAEHLPAALRGDDHAAADASERRYVTLAEAEARHIDAILGHTGGRIGAAASILGIHRNTLTRKLRDVAAPDDRGVLRGVRALGARVARAGRRGRARDAGAIPIGRKVVGH